MWGVSFLLSMNISAFWIILQKFGLETFWKPVGGEICSARIRGIALFYWISSKVMGKAGGNLPRRPISRLRSRAAESGEPPSSHKALAPEVAEPSHALTRAAAEDSTTLAHAAVRAVTQAAEACEGMEVEPGISMNEALLDPVHRAQAARWRSGPEHRKVAAILARMMQALHGIRPAWISSPGSQNPPVAEPLPVRRATTAGSHGSLPAGVQWCLQKIRAFSYGWKTWCLIMLLVIFPKVLASLLTLMVRLVSELDSLL